MGYNMMQEGDVFKTKSYGDLIITKYVNSKAVCVKFVVTGYETTTKASNVIAGSVKDRLLPTVHGIGITGDSQVRVDGKHTKEYRLWNNMLKRCYSVGCQKVRPTYIDCSVSENFRYLQYFKEWCNNQIGFNSVDEKGKPFALDKDILVKGNRVYNEDVCVFVPQEVNLLFTKRDKSRGEYPIGVSFHKSRGMLTATLNNKYLGYFNTAEQAFQVYKTAKEAYIKEVANKWKDKIDPKVYEALMNYEVHIDD